MFRFTLSRTLTLVSIGTALLSAATLASLHGSTANRALQSDPPHQVADSLDSLIQPRFQDDRAGVFGLSRIQMPAQLPGVRGHMITRVDMQEQLRDVTGHMGLAVLQPKTPTETALLHQANAAHRDYVIAFLHCAHVPGHLRRPNYGITMNTLRDKPYLETLAAHPFRQIASSQQAHAQDVNLLGRTHFSNADYTAVSHQAIAALPRLRQGTSQETSVNNWLVVMRPITAGKDSCLGCHEGAKKGDTLGVMVYAVNKKAGTGG